MFARQVRNELLKLFARRRTYIGFAVFLLVELVILALLNMEAVLLAFSHLLENNGLEFSACYTGLTLATFIIFFTVTILFGLYLALVSGDMVAKEVEEGTMRMVLSRPVKRLRLLAIKIIACVAYTFALGVFIGATALLAACLYMGGVGNLMAFGPMQQVFAVFGPSEGLWRYALSILLMCACYQLVSAIALMLSCFRIRPAAATIVTVTVLSVDLVLRNIPFFQPLDHYFLGYHLGCWIRAFRHVVLWPDIAESLLLLVGATLTCWVIGAAEFCTRDFKA